MKSVALTFFLATSVFADVPVPRPATQAEVNAGMLTQPYVSPATLAGAGLTNGTFTGNGAGITNVNVTTATGTLPQSALPSSVVTNGATNVLIGLQFSTGMCNGTTNYVSVINSFEFPQASGNYSFSTVFGAYTNSAATNIQIFYDSSQSEYAIGTNRATDSSGVLEWYYYVGSQAFPTNDPAYWLVTNAFAAQYAIGINIVNAVTSTNNSTSSLNFNYLTTSVTVNPDYYPMTEGMQELIFGIPATNNQALGINNNPILPMFTAGSENSGVSGTTTTSGRIATWSWTQGTASSSLTMQNTLRVFGISGDWWKSGITDPRSVILKGEADSTDLGFGTFMVETRTPTGSPGTHGNFANSFKVTTNGTVAIGNLTDAADASNALKPVAWLSIYGDGSTWSGGASTLPSFAILSKALVGTPVAAGEENDGTYRYWTDNSAVRHRYLMDSLPGNGSGLTNSQASIATISAGTLVCSNQVAAIIAATPSGGSILATLVTNNAPTPIVVTGSGASVTTSSNQIVAVGAGVSTVINSNSVTTGTVVANNFTGNGGGITGIAYLKNFFTAFNNSGIPAGVSWLAQGGATEASDGRADFMSTRPGWVTNGTFLNKGGGYIGTGTNIAIVFCVRGVSTNILTYWYGSASSAQTAFTNSGTTAIWWPGGTNLGFFQLTNSSGSTVASGGYLTATADLLITNSP